MKHLERQERVEQHCRQKESGVVPTWENEQPEALYYHLPVDLVCSGSSLSMSNPRERTGPYFLGLRARGSGGVVGLDKQGLPHVQLLLGQLVSHEHEQSERHSSPSENK